jgi:hypothetical protein
MRRLLAHETLSTDQIWWAVMADHRHDESDPLSDLVPEAVMVIADEQSQVFQSLAQADREPWLAVSETQLRSLLNQALPSITQKLTQAALRVTGAPAWWSPSHRYGVAVLSDVEGDSSADTAATSSVITWHWLSASSAADAIETLESQGIRGEISQLIDVQVIMQVLADMEQVRKDRGAGVFTDARFIGSMAARRRALNAEKHGGEQMYQASLAARRASLGRPAPQAEGLVEFPA